MAEPAWVLDKLSTPGWTENFATKDELVEALRGELCFECLDECEPEYNGKKFVCRDLQSLLRTPCGCEYQVETPESEAA